MSDLDVYMLGAPQQGWGPVAKMARQFSLLVDTPLITLPERSRYTRRFLARSLVPRGQRSRGKKAFLVAGVPGQLRGLVESPLWRGGYEEVHAWVIDSFWDDRVPRLLQGTKHVDRVWVADANDVDPWDAMFRGRVGVLPWGTDALGVMSGPNQSEVKGIDILRVGRQPDAFDDDDANGSAARSLGLKYAGRPPFGHTVEESQRLLEESLARAKGMLAFTNLVDSTAYTHPSKEYVTGRWTDALSHGVIPVGKRPNTDTARELVPDHLRVEIDPFNRESAMRDLKTWIDEYSDETAVKARIHALRRLDWRHRYAKILSDMGIPFSPQLTTDLQRIEDIAQHLEQRGRYDQ